MTAQSLTKTLKVALICAAGVGARAGGDVPKQYQLIHGVPMLVPGATSSVRRQLEDWFARHRLVPIVVGEFDDAALMKAFGREGQGVFMTPSVLDDETCRQFGVEVLGRTTDLVEEFYAVSVERRITHPCVLAITDAARGQLFGV